MTANIIITLLLMIIAFLMGCVAGVEYIKEKHNIK